MKFHRMQATSSVKKIKWDIACCKPSSEDSGNKIGCSTNYITASIELEFEFPCWTVQVWAEQSRTGWQPARKYSKNTNFYKQIVIEWTKSSGFQIFTKKNSQSSEVGIGFDV